MTPEQLYDAISKHGEAIAALFTGEVKVSILVRDPSRPDDVALFSRDDIREVEETLRRLRDLGQSGLNGAV